MPPRAQIVIGLGFGDEGKGLATDWLCGQALARQETPLVVRFNGGHQAGHTVTTATGQRHVFSNFGSGTLRGVPTYWSELCTFSPGGVLNEYAALRALGVVPRLLVARVCAVATPYDVLYNKLLEAERGAGRHGSCGVGFGATVVRHRDTPLRLYAQDLLSPTILARKLGQIRAHYAARIAAETTTDFAQFDHDAADQHFLRQAQGLAGLQASGAVQFVAEAEVFAPAAPWQTYIFEGAQGVLLDQDFGMFPHVTHSRTSSANALEILQPWRPELAATATIFGVSRAYHTRHGAGPLPHETALDLHNNAAETNQLNEHQGHFRTAPLSVELLKYALECDAKFSAGLTTNLLITCLDQVPGGLLPVWHEGRLQRIELAALPGLLGVAVASCRGSYGADGRGL